VVGGKVKAWDHPSAWVYRSNGSKCHAGQYWRYRAFGPKRVVGDVIGIKYDWQCRHSAVAFFRNGLLVGAAQEAFRISVAPGCQPMLIMDVFERSALHSHVKWMPQF
jgi:hypothetical protein